MSSQRSYSFSRQVLVNGIRDGIPIGLGYFAVSFSLGIAARKAGLSPFQGFLASLFNNASAGEYAAFTLIAANAGYLQVAIITLIANARYLLMSCALAQRFSPDTPFFHRFLISKSDGSACCSQHVTDFAGKRAAGFVVFVHRVPSFCVLQKFWVYGQFLKIFYADTIKKIVTLLGRKVTTKFFIFCCPAGIPRPVPPSAPARWSCDRDAMHFLRRKGERCRYRHRQRGSGQW